MGTKANQSIHLKKTPRKHNHLTMGRTGWIPQGVGVTDIKLLKR